MANTKGNTVEPKSKKRRFAILAIAVMLVGIVGYQSVLTRNLMSEVNQLEIEALEQPAKEEISLGYTLEDLKTLRNEPLTMETRKLLPDEWYKDILIPTWAGDDYIIAVPNSNAKSEPPDVLMNRRNIITLLSSGKVVAQYSTGDWDACDIQLLPDKMLLWVRFKPTDASITREGISQGIAEVDYDGNFLWGMGIEALSHSIELLPNGNFLSVRGDFDQVIEFTREGELVWEWNCLEGIPAYGEDTFSGWNYPTHPDLNVFSEFRMPTGKKVIWTHLNAVQKLDDGYLISLRNLNMAVKVGFDKEVKWTFGALLWKYQHRPIILDNGNVLVYDNGNGEVAEYQIDGTKVWNYPINSRRWGRIYKLDNGNYLFPNSFQGIILEVDPNGEVVKEVKMGKMCIIHYGGIELLEKIK